MASLKMQQSIICAEHSLIRGETDDVTAVLTDLIKSNIDDVEVIGAIELAEYLATYPAITLNILHNFILSSMK